MLSGEGNENGEKTTIGLISKKTTLHVQYISLPLFCTTTTWNFQKLPSYTFYGGNVVPVVVHFFSHAHFHLVAAWISHFLTAAKFVLPKNSSLSSALALCRFFLVELRWPVADFIFSLYSKFVDMTIINLSLIQRIQKQFPLSIFVFIGSLVVSASQDADGYAISRQNNLVLYLGCHTSWLSYFTLVCLWYGRTVG